MAAVPSPLPDPMRTVRDTGPRSERRRPWLRHAFSTGMPEPRFSAVCSSDASVLTFTLTGSLDADSVMALESMHEQMVSAGFDEVVVDIGQLSFVDGAGTRSLESLGTSIKACGARVTVRDKGTVVGASRRAPHPL